MDKSVFDELNAVDVSKYIETKNTGKVALKYLSWSNAWQEVKKRYPDAKATVKMFDNKPYIYDNKTGYMVFTEVTINNETQEMWLPVMDSHNEAMMDTARTVKTKYSSYTVEACTMFDINKTIMRCMAKNLAMFGLGLYIYNGEDLPENVDDTPVQKPANKPVAPAPKTINNVKVEPTNDELQLEGMLEAYKEHIPADVAKMCNDALNTHTNVESMLMRLITYLGKKGIQIK